MNFNIVAEQSPTGVILADQLTERNNHLASLAIHQTTECDGKHHISPINTNHREGVREGLAVGTVPSHQHALLLIVMVAPLTIDELLVVICLS